MTILLAHWQHATDSLRQALTQPLLAALMLATLVVSTAQGHEDHTEENTPTTFTEAMQHAPTPIPDRVMLSFCDDPATSIDVTWRTDTSTNLPIVQFLAAEKLRGRIRNGEVPNARTAQGKKREFSTDLGASHRHEARLSGLKPNQMYAYRVGDGDHWSEWHHFRTASDQPDPFTFVYFGDAQNDVLSMWARVVREANQHAPRSAFMLHAGDLINKKERDAEWGEWFTAGGWLNGMIPSLATPGNHEYNRAKELSSHWRHNFSFPLNGPKGLEETVYWLDYQGVRLISLNTNEQIEKQTAWLKSVLSDPKRPKWTIVTFHHPIFSAAKERDNPALRNAWRSILEESGVDLVLQGHDHAYARSGLGGPYETIKNVPEGMQRKSSNTVYVVSVSGPKMYPVQEKWKLPRSAAGVQLFQIIKVSQDEIQYEARTAEGTLYDAFTLTKEKGVSKLIEQVPNNPEILEKVD